MCGVWLNVVEPFLRRALPAFDFIQLAYDIADNHPYDARVSLRGSEVEMGDIESVYYVEVTSAVFEREHLEREALAQDGSVFHDPNIHHVGSRHKGDRRIVSHATAEDGDTPLKELQGRVISAIETKDSHTYKKPSILIVRAEPSRPLALSEWSSLVATTNRWRTLLSSMLSLLSSGIVQ
jgi:hypothetical protein